MTLYASFGVAYFNSLTIMRNSPGLLLGGARFFDETFNTGQLRLTL